MKNHSPAHSVFVYPPLRSPCRNMVTGTIWDTVYAVKHDEEEPKLAPGHRFVLYAVAQDPCAAAFPPSSSIIPQSHSITTHTPTYPPPIFPATRFRVPLPRDTNPGIRMEVRVHGEPGLQLSRCCSVDESIGGICLRGIIMHLVDDANKSVDHFCHGYYLWVNRAPFYNEKVRSADERATPKYSQSGVTQAHLLALMVERQHKHWSEITSLFDEVDLEPLVGAIWAKGSQVSWDSLYIVAIRRYQSTAIDGSYRWFPEIEVRVTS
ncbi:hypothetical protein C8Q79DRAFT_451818 [Trametes meyenii]|nr:hypothetical protein C8Q79DRAFT_451818 [Trametes meyenii]